MSHVHALQYKHIRLRPVLVRPQLGHLWVHLLGKWLSLEDVTWYRRVVESLHIANVNVTSAFGKNRPLVGFDEGLLGLLPQLERLLWSDIL